jgi:hypothetical protein
MSDENHNEVKFKTPFGILEEEFVRTVAKGNYSPVVHELDQLILQGKLTYNELKVLYYIKSKTIDFRNTHIRLRRKDIASALKIDPSNNFKAIKSLVLEKYILEKEDQDSYFYYALNPKIFGGTIVLRSTSEASRRLNTNEKRRLGIKTNGNKPRILWQKAKDLMVKYHKEDLEMLEKTDAYAALKYTLIKYTLLNGLSALAGERIFQILDQANNPEYLIKQFVSLMETQPDHVLGMSKELIRAYTENTDCNNRPIKTNAATYFITCWDNEAKKHWQSLVFKQDHSPEMVAKRKEYFEVIMDYPITSNVVSFKKTQYYRK